MLHDNLNMATARLLIAFRSEYTNWSMLTANVTYKSVCTNNIDEWIIYP